MRRTAKDDIMTSFLKLLNEKPFDKITVREITQDCGINRNTFYYYFQDIYDLLECVLDTATTRAMERKIEYNGWEDGFLKSIEFARKNRRAIYHIYKSVNRDMLDKYLGDVAERVMLATIRRQTEGLEVREDDVLLLASFYKHALVGCIIEWLNSGMKGTPDADLRRIGELLDGNIRYTFLKQKCTV